jgi:hypothetical protein
MRFMTELTKSQVLDGICFDQVVITQIKIDIFQYRLRKNEYYQSYRELQYVSSKY